jgi:GcrA cell cycle regulator
MTNPSPVATWNPERVEQLRNCVIAGLTCSQIAGEIGVSRNAVIGKIHRLGLSPGRPAAAPARLCPPRVRPPRLPSQRRLLRLHAKTPPLDPTAAQDEFVNSAQRCSLLQLARGKCRWPISDPGASDFAFCGNDAIAGLSYCAGHARMAYRPAGRRSA